MIEWFKKLIGGWLPIGTKPFGEYAGKILWCVGIVLMVSLATNVWEKLFPSKPSVVNVQGDYIQEKQDVAHFGCSMWRGYIKTGITK